MPVYRALTAVLAPLARRRLKRSAQGFPELGGRDSERLGEVTADDPGALWIHAASVGELNASTPLIERLLDTTDRHIVLSNLTATAASQATRRYAGEDRVQTLLAPLDRPRAVGRWLDRVRPAGLLLIETELWPVLLAECRRRGIPVAIVNARLSENAYRGYRRVRSLFASLLEPISTIACQAPTDAERFAALGARPEACVVTGNIKFDAGPLPGLPADVETMAGQWTGRPTWIAGSTHAGEEPLLAEAHRRLADRHKGALLVLVPRHPERAPDARRTLELAGLRLAGLDDDPRPAQAVVVDRLGVLAGLYGHAGVVFVGGSLVDGIGGHNIIEAAQSGRPVLTGPFTADQHAAAEGLASAGGLVRVENSDSLAESVSGLWADPERVENQVQRAADFLAGQRGALDRTAAILMAWLEEP